MGTRYFLTQPCPHCDRLNYDIYYAPTCDFTTWRCEYCEEEFNIPLGFSAEEDAKYAEEITRDSKALEDLVNSFAKETPAPMPVISQLAIAIEETLIVYHEPHFIRWACRVLQGIVDKGFNPTEYMDIEEACTWAGLAATECISAAKQPVLDNLINDAATAVECALRAQDAAVKKKGDKE